MPKTKGPKSVLRAAKGQPVSLYYAHWRTGDLMAAHGTLGEINDTHVAVLGPKGGAKQVSLGQVRRIMIGFEPSAK